MVIASWLDEKEVRGALTPIGEREVAVRDFEDIDACNTMVLFGDPERRGQGGRNVELGYAIGTGKMVIVVGFRENPFWYHPAVRFVEDVGRVLELL